MTTVEEVGWFRSRHINMPPDTESGDGKRQRILDAALEIAASEGVRGASLRRISSHVGMRTATLYSYFPEGKDQLISSAMSSLLSAFYYNAAKGLRPEDSSLENLRGTIFRHIRWVLDKPRLAPAWDVVIAADRITPVLNEAVRNEVLELSAGYRKLLRALLEDCGIDRSDAPQMAEMIIVICDGAYKWNSPNGLHNGTLDTEELAWLSVRRLLGMVAADGQEPLRSSLAQIGRSSHGL